MPHKSFEKDVRVMFADQVVAHAKIMRQHREAARMDLIKGALATVLIGTAIGLAFYLMTWSFWFLTVFFGG